MLESVGVLVDVGVSLGDDVWVYVWEGEDVAECDDVGVSVHECVGDVVGVEDGLHVMVILDVEVGDVVNVNEGVAVTE